MNLSEHFGQQVALFLQHDLVTDRHGLDGYWYVQQIRVAVGDNEPGQEDGGDACDPD